MNEKIEHALRAHYAQEMAIRNLANAERIFENAEAVLSAAEEEELETILLKNQQASDINALKKMEKGF